MTKKATLTTITSGYASKAQLNSNFNAINDKFDNTLSLDGSTPNQMKADFDLNNYDILNANSVSVQALTIAGVKVTSLASVPEWKGEWASSTPYIVNDIVSDSGNTYICVTNHTSSSSFSNDLSLSYWELMAAKGAAGAGTGDMLAANNLSDVANTDTSLSNLGGGTVGISVFKGTTASDIRTTISAQQQNDILDDLSGLTQAANKIPYFNSSTTASTLDFLDEDDFTSDSASGVPSQQSVAAYLKGDTYSWSYISDVNSIEFTDLGDYSRLVIDLLGITTSALTRPRIRVSNDNGTTYHSSGYDSKASDNDTGNTSSSDFILHDGAQSSFIPGTIFINNFKDVLYTTCVGLFARSKVTGYYTTSESHNAIQIFVGSGNITGGDIQIKAYRY